MINEKLVQKEPEKKVVTSTFNIKYSLHPNKKGSIFKYALQYDEEYPFELKNSISEEQYQEIINKLLSFSHFYQPQNIYTFVVFCILFWCIIPTSISMRGIFSHLFIYYIIFGFFSILIIASYIYAFGIKITNYVRVLNTKYSEKSVKFEYRKTIPTAFFVLLCFSVQIYIQILLVTKSEKEENYKFLLAFSSFFLFADVLGIAFFIRHIVLLSNFSCRGGRVETDHINYLNGLCEYYAKPYSFLISYPKENGIPKEEDDEDFKTNNNNIKNNAFEDNSFDNNTNNFNQQNNFNNYNNNQNNYNNNQNFNNSYNYNNNQNNYNNQNLGMLVDTSSDDPFRINSNN
ncbi:hypothetical protein DICPUDRAFT_147300 [Dictyostelium purpureum]|uniref:Uncharacterized protein n=1 Tax=Dictyostelium purpureum TaxID=5786 RepID=F0Z854_DICPU|nr:uncharacterized protein DICPUDRAFT_147300 [Dictyostelium purpureum]EGC39869.1 hypothetical protein DICPUDRAFT_147300 [Dictyostelium purpureum]|eukprot:XP_003283620.1 hypothetical protein DICPUDRAFT_147300 [Dictyostelium purpureum]